MHSILRLAGCLQEVFPLKFLNYALHAFDNIIQNVLVVIEETDVIAFLLENVDLHNGQLFQKRESQNFQRFADIKQLQNGFSSNITG